MGEWNASVHTSASGKGSIIYNLILKLIIEYRQVYGVGKKHMDSSYNNDNDRSLLLLLIQLCTTVQF